MKLISLKIGELPDDGVFRSLYSGFEVKFHELSDEGIQAMHEFNPFCFAGLNGSGKSNVLEALAAIFFHLECCVAKFKPLLFEKQFDSNVCKPDAFILEYLIGRKNTDEYTAESFFKITITKESNCAPKLFRQSFPFSITEKVIEESLEPPKNKNSKEPAPGKIYLPDIIIGYSSGENEILSLPFRKSRFLNFDKYREDYIAGRPFEEPENSLIYIDNTMSQAVLLSCLLFENEDTLIPISKELGILGIQSFRINLNIQALSVSDDKKTFVPILQHMVEAIESLKKCASSWQEFSDKPIDLNDRQFSTLVLDFFVDSQTKAAFKTYFNNSFDLFRFFQVLYELNANFITDEIKEEVYKSKGFYIDGKIPEGSPNQKVFYFLDFLILKQLPDEKQPKELLLREFSDGEHQFLHTLGICLMLKGRRSLLLLDEPETHFNPSWRAKFIKILGESISTLNKNSKNDHFNVHLLKDVILTSHSPFIISDCMPDNVIFFERDDKSHKLFARKATDLGLNTYGSSVDYILKNFFKTDLISNKSFAELKDIIDKGEIDQLRKAVDHFGESSEKQFLFQKIYEKMNEKK